MVLVAITALCVGEPSWCYISDMQHVRLGRTGLQVSRICLGTMTFGLQIDEDASRAVLDKAAELGVTFLDTADAYPLGGDLTTAGRTEEIVGRWLQGKRSDYVVATKCFAPMGRNRWDMGNSRRHIMDAIDASLRRLQTDFVDLYQLHFDDPGVPLDETLGALDDLVRVGKVRYVGCSNFLAYRLARALGRSEVLGIARFDSVQPRYNLLFREFERELFPLCLEEGVAVIPYNPIAGGMLSGKHDRTKAARRRNALRARQRGADVPGPLLARQRVRHRRRTREDRRRRRHPAADARRRVDAAASRDHVAHRRREPSRATRRDDRGGRHAARRRPRRPVERRHRRIPPRRRTPLIR